MGKWLTILKKSYIFIILGLFYIPLAIGVMYSFQTVAKKGDIGYFFIYSGMGWDNLIHEQTIVVAFLTSLITSLLVGLIVTPLSLIVVYGLWRTRSRVAKNFVTTTSGIPLINPDIITALALTLVFSLAFGVLSRHDNGFERVVIGQATMIIPFGITLMYPKSEKFKPSIIEASHDLGYGPVRTWFKTYFRHMLGLVIIVFLIAVIMSFDDFIITKTVSRETTIGRLMYEGKFRPWILALGTIVLALTFSISLFYSLWQLAKDVKRRRHGF